jgi:hypothetical protein
VAFLL